MNVNIRNMTENEYSNWIKLSTEQQAIDRHKVSSKPVDEERNELKKLLPHILPDGVYTSESIFLSIDTDEDKNIGFLWFHELPSIPEKAIFLMDIQLEKSKRSKGYGKIALVKAHKLLKNLGYENVLLNVLIENYAKDLYSKLGYIGVEDNNNSILMNYHLG